VLGLIGEYIASIFEEIKGRPIYIVDTARLPGADEKGLTDGTGS